MPESVLQWNRNLSLGQPQNVSGPSHRNTSAGIDTSKFAVTSMSGLKRTVRKLGPHLTHG